MTAMTAIGALRAPQPSACVLQPETHPPIGPLLKTKVKVHFDRTVTERSKLLFPVFQGSNPVQFQPCFTVFSVRSAEGRGLYFRLRNYQITHLPNSVEIPKKPGISHYFLFVKELLGTCHPEALPNCSAFLPANQQRIRTILKTNRVRNNLISLAILASAEGK